MGNSLRSTFGNMCGAEASKEGPQNDPQKPVDKRSERKKEKKSKNKKNKENKHNGTLASVEEDHAAEPEVLAAGEKTPDKPAEEVAAANNTPPPPRFSVYDGVDESYDAYESPKDYTLNIDADKNYDINTKLDADTPKNSVTTPENYFITPQKNANIDVINPRLNVNIVDIPQDCVNIEKNCHNKTDPIETVSKINTQDNSSNLVIEFGKSTDSLKSNSSDGKGSSDAVQKIHKIEVVSLEDLGIRYADDIFSNFNDTYNPFVEDSYKLHAAITDFEKAVVVDYTEPDFEHSWICYNDLLENLSDVTTQNKVDISDIHVKAQTMRANAIQLSGTIKRVQPELERFLSEASTDAVIEYVNGKKIDNLQLGMNKKFSAPSKHRHNIAKLKNALKDIKDVDREVKQILSFFNDKLDIKKGVSKKTEIYDNESIILPVEQIVDHADVDFFANLEKEQPPPMQNDDEQLHAKYGAASKPVDIKTNSTSQAAMSSNSLIKNQTVKSSKKENPDEEPEVVTKTYIIENIPEKSNIESSSAPSSIAMTTRSVSMNKDMQKDDINDVVVEDEEHNTLDFGKYCFIDPSTGDIQVMRNRSRSLDSLVSMSSNRSSLSRFGSFEFVTGFEIVIAEKNQAMAAAK